MIDVRVIEVKPHPDQATNNPGCWAVQLEVSHSGRRRAFWRWYTERNYVHGRFVASMSKTKPKAGDILQRFWDDTFAELHGFAFDKEMP